MTEVESFLHQSWFPQCAKAKVISCWGSTLSYFLMKLLLPFGDILAIHGPSSIQCYTLLMKIKPSCLFHEESIKLYPMISITAYHSKTGLPTYIHKIFFTSQKLFNVLEYFLSIPLKK